MKKLQFKGKSKLLCNRLKKIQSKICKGEKKRVVEYREYTKKKVYVNT